MTKSDVTLGFGSLTSSAHSADCVNGSLDGRGDALSKLTNTAFCSPRVREEEEEREETKTARGEEETRRGEEEKRRRQAEEGKRAYPSVQNATIYTRVRNIQERRQKANKLP